jgi:ubiquitin-like protein Pup
MQDWDLSLLVSTRRPLHGHKGEIMGEQVRKEKTKSSSKQEEQVTTDVVEETDSAEDLKKRLDDLLDEVDEVLEENGISTTAEAATFVSQYIQKGGE